MDTTGDTSKIHVSKLSGMYDQKNSIMYFLIPPWVKEKYSERIQSLLINSSERVTTNLDVLSHDDFTHLMSFNEPVMRSKHGQSLFTPIPKNRTCADAGISTNYCTCVAHVQLDTKLPDVVAAASVAVDFMNKQVVAIWEGYRKKGMVIEDGKVLSPKPNDEAKFCQKNGRWFM